MPDLVEVRYGLTIHALGAWPFVEISQERFEVLRDARSWLSEALAIEESYHRALGNFFEFESFLLERALHHALFVELTWSETVAEIHDLGRRLLNLLSSGRAYVDHADTTIKRRCGAGSDERSGFRASCSEQYDTLFGYRVMCRLRNHAQHRGLAVNSLNHKNWRPPHHEGTTRNALVATLNVARLREEGGFHPETLEMLEALREPIVDLRPLVREYVVGLGHVNDAVRESISAKVDAATTATLEAIDEYEAEGAGIRGLVAMVERPDGTVAEHVPVMGELIDRRKELFNRSRFIRFAGTSFTTNEPGG